MDSLALTRNCCMLRRPWHYVCITEWNNFIASSVQNCANQEHQVPKAISVSPEGKPWTLKIKFVTFKWGFQTSKWGFEPWNKALGQLNMSLSLLTVDLLRRLWTQKWGFRHTKWELENPRMEDFTGKGGLDPEMKLSTLKLSWSREDSVQNLGLKTNRWSNLQTLSKVSKELRELLELERQYIRNFLG